MEDKSRPLQAWQHTPWRGLKRREGERALTAKATCALPRIGTGTGTKLDFLWRRATENRSASTEEAAPALELWRARGPWYHARTPAELEACVPHLVSLTRAGGRGGKGRAVAGEEARPAARKAPAAT